MIKIIEAINSNLNNVNIILNNAVLSLEDKAEFIKLETKEQSYIANKVIVTLPPRLAAKTIQYLPALENNKYKEMNNIPTWMGAITKCLISYEDSFWRNDNLSGNAISHIGPLREIHDISSSNQGILFGFLRIDKDTSTLKEDIKKQLLRLFGHRAINYKEIEIVNWSEEIYTSTLSDKTNDVSHPNYGFSYSHFDNKLEFIGTETSYRNGGYIEGALQSAIDISNRICK